MNRVKFYFIVILMLPILCLCFSSCGMTEGNEVTQEKKDEVVERFLNEFYCFNKDERYVLFLQMAENMEQSEGLNEKENETQEISEISRQAYKDSYAALAKMSTQNCFDNMQKNRLPVQYDKYVMENDVSVQVDEMEYKAIEENIYEFSITFKSNSETFSSPMKGKLEIKIIDEEVLIDEIIIY